jgi:hypothetical protein
MSDEPKLVYLGTVEAANAIIIPRRAIAKANEAFDAERARREREAERAKLRVRQQATARSRLRRALRACFGGRER